MKVSMKVNGTAYEHDVEPRTLLVQHLRENMGLTGTHVGCDTSSCGACTIIVNGETVKSCTIACSTKRWCGNKNYRRYGNKRRTASRFRRVSGKSTGCSVDSALLVWLCLLGNCWNAIQNHQKMK